MNLFQPGAVACSGRSRWSRASAAWAPTLGAPAPLLPPKLGESTSTAAVGSLLPIWACFSLARPHSGPLRFFFGLGRLVKLVVHGQTEKPTEPTEPTKPTESTGKSASLIRGKRQELIARL
ncbi:hypothetical protein N7462_008807 [Penicillium macrosclerotiorum]|uniref:uncharacterized protein n=1 Tax=Penicillium macrosclerotiorum TaxID=303699 RepID=UPI002546FE01|nr:uncharacterized protein N7462_008807 [Penicillium macrosclerotiorum]KAJ5675910.1 hypothetical protein N7462_008807 [Penicillium macrosclerotiorum]